MNKFARRQIRRREARQAKQGLDALRRPNPAVEDFNSREGDGFAARGEEVHAISIPGGVYGHLFLYSEPYITRSQADSLMAAGLPRFNDEVCIW